MQIYSSDFTKELCSPFFFLVDKQTNELPNLCLKLKRLLEPSHGYYPANVNEQVNSSATALHHAVCAACVQERSSYSKWAPAVLCNSMLGRQNAEKLMAEKRANGFVSPNPSELKISYGELVVEYLCEKGANVNARDTEGRTPIFWAKRPEIIRMLRQRGTDLGIKKRYVSEHIGSSNREINVGISAAYSRIEEGNVRAIEALFEQIPGKSNFNIREDEKGRFYREGQYIVRFGGDATKPTVTRIERLPDRYRPGSVRIFKSDKDYQ